MYRCDSCAESGNGRFEAPYLYDSSTKTVADGEGVWLAVGSASSNPSVSSHYSVIYKDANEHKFFVDCQGLIADTTCRATWLPGKSDSVKNYFWGSYTRYEKSLCVMRRSRS